MLSYVTMFVFDPPRLNLSGVGKSMFENRQSFDRNAAGFGPIDRKSELKSLGFVRVIARGCPVLILVQLLVQLVSWLSKMSSAGSAAAKVAQQTYRNAKTARERWIIKEVPCFTRLLA